MVFYEYIYVLEPLEFSYSRHHAPLAQLDRRDRPEVQFLYGAPVIY